MLTILRLKSNFKKGLEEVILQVPLLPAAVLPSQVHSKFRLVMNNNYKWELGTFLSEHLEIGNQSSM